MKIIGDSFILIILAYSFLYIPIEIIETQERDPRWPWLPVIIFAAMILCSIIVIEKVTQNFVFSSRLIATIVIISFYSVWTIKRLQFLKPPKHEPLRPGETRNVIIYDYPEIKHLFREDKSEADKKEIAAKTLAFAVCGCFLALILLIAVEKFFVFILGYSVLLTGYSFGYLIMNESFRNIWKINY